jgi:hypothetical protein
MSDLSIYENRTLGGDHCWYCGDWLFEGIKTKDHFWPKSRGGRLMVRCCKNCNGMKGHMTPLIFIAYVKELKAENPAKQNLFPRFDRIIHATQTLWDRVRWSIETK